jgi:excisionase family DNA binding protein
MSQYLTVADVAGLAQVSKRTVMRWVQSNRLPAVRLSPRLLRFRADAIDEALKQLQAAAPAR